jgi:hypothetical protein
MPETQVILYKEKDGTVPLLAWLDALPAKVQLKCVARVGFNGMNYRMLYFFHGNIAAVVSHGIVKEAKVPPKEIDQAIERMTKFEHDPETHTYKE